MLLKYLFELFTQHIPETLAIAYTGTVFLKNQLKFKPILYIGFISGVLILLLRKLPMTFGFHTIIYIFIVTMMFHYFYKKESLECFIAVLKTIILLTILEVIFSYIFISFTSLNVELIRNNSGIKSLVILPQNLLLFLIGYYLYKRRKKKPKKGDN